MRSDGFEDNAAVAGYRACGTEEFVVVYALT